MKIVFYNKTLISGGIEKCIESLCKYLYNDYELEVVYTDDSRLNIDIVRILERYAKVYKIEDDMQINCDLCIWCFLYFDYDKLKDIIKAKEYIAWIHSMPRTLDNCLLDYPKFVNDCSRFICVSQAVKDTLNISKDGEIIYNFMDKSIPRLALEHNPFSNIPKDVLKISVVSRLASGKGFDRLLLMVQSLKKLNIPFKVIIVGKGSLMEPEIKRIFSIFDEVEFVGYKENPYPYIKNSDYLVQLSDEESWCNSITEAKILQVPVVLTNFLSAKEQITNNVNGIIVPLEEKNYDDIVINMYNSRVKLKNNLKGFKFENEIDKWMEIFNSVEQYNSVHN